MLPVLKLIYTEHFMSAMTKLDLLLSKLPDTSVHHHGISFIKFLLMLIREHAKALRVWDKEFKAEKA
jgi:hypothetical protein